MLVGAIGLLAGDRADPSVVRPGAEEAVVQGRFVMRRRRGRPHPGGAPQRSVARLPRRPPGHRRGAGRAGRCPRRPARAARPRRAPHHRQPAPGPRSVRGGRPRRARGGPRRGASGRRRARGLGGDAGARERELDFLRFQLDEIERGGSHGPGRGRAPRGRGVAARRRRRPPRRRGRRRCRARHRTGRPRPDSAPRWPRSAIRAAVRAPSWSGSRAWPPSWTTSRTTSGRPPRPSTSDPERLAAVQARRAALADLRRRYTADRPLQPGRPVRGAGRAGRPRWPTSTATPSAAAAAEAAHAEALDGRGAVGGGRRANAAGASPARWRPPCRRDSPSSRCAKAQVVDQVGDDDPGDDVSFLLALNPGLPAAAARQGGLGRRAGAHDAGAAAGRRGAGAHPRVRRGRRRGGRERGPLGGAGPGRAGRRASRCWWSPTSRRSRRSPTPRSRSRSTTTAPPR